MTFKRQVFLLVDRMSRDVAVGLAIGCPRHTFPLGRGNRESTFRTSMLYDTLGRRSDFVEETLRTLTSLLFRMKFKFVPKVLRHGDFGAVRMASVGIVTTRRCHVDSVRRP